MRYLEQLAVTPETMGDWDGEEDLAAMQVNRILQAIDRVLPEDLDVGQVESIFYRVWSDWSYDLRLLDVNEQDIRRYAQSLAQSQL